jgi:signal transduction histidine kinase
VNLINNSRYWLHQVERSDRKVLLSTFNERVLISDNGPGIAREDQPDLFRLFFTRRQGGRGVGLYLCRSNLAAGGHRITYATDEKDRPLPGATFAIEFREASFPL